MPQPGARLPPRYPPSLPLPRQRWPVGDHRREPSEERRPPGQSPNVHHNKSRTDLWASDRAETRKVYLQVKTKPARPRVWQTQTTRGRSRDPEPDEHHFRVFVELRGIGDLHTYYVVLEWWIENDIAEAHAAYPARHGGERPRSPGSTHHSIEPEWIARWRDRWDVLGVFQEVR